MRFRGCSIIPKRKLKRINPGRYLLLESSTYDDNNCPIIVYTEIEVLHTRHSPAFDSWSMTFKVVDTGGIDQVEDYILDSYLEGWAIRNLV